MIKILSGFTGPGGSTIAFNNLVNLFNDNGMEACLYGKQGWKGITCNYENNYPAIQDDEIVIYHFLKLPREAKARKMILSCHETNLFPIKETSDLEYDAIHFVSDFQKEWQGIDGVVIPNVINPYIGHPIPKLQKTAGIIGSIDPHKRVHRSIDRALEDQDIDTVQIWGNISVPDYFLKEVAPRLGKRVSYHGIATKMQSVYDGIDVVYASSERECLPTIQGECLKAGIPFRGLDANMRSESSFEFDNHLILKKWKSLLYD